MPALTITLLQSQGLYDPATPAASTTMRPAPSQPRSRAHAVQRAQETEPVAKKVFNCIVDDTALVQGAKKSTRDGIPKWIAAGQIRLFVPLYSVYNPLDAICIFLLRTTSEG